MDQLEITLALTLYSFRRFSFVQTVKEDDNWSTVGASQILGCYMHNSEILLKVV